MGLRASQEVQASALVWLSLRRLHQEVERMYLVPSALAYYPPEAAVYAAEAEGLRAFWETAEARETFPRQLSPLRPSLADDVRSLP